MAATIPIEGLDAIRQAQEQRRLEQEIIRGRWQLAKQTVWLSLLTASFLIFYLVDILQQSMTLLGARY